MLYNVQALIDVVEEIVKYDVEQALGDVKSQHCVMLYNVQALIDVVELSLVEVELVPSDVELALIDVVELSLVEAELVVCAMELHWVMLLS